MATLSSSIDDSMRVLEQCRVSPSPASITEQQPASLPLTFFDILWLYTSPVERLFLYPFPHPTVVFTESYLPNLKSSLSLALHHFYPLAGKVRRSPDDSPSAAHLYELHYAEGDSVSLTVAETDLDFLDLVGYHARDSSKLSSLVPRLPQLDDDNRPLLAIQVTLFPDHGIGIGFTVHHVACDGFNSTHFIKSWASSCKSRGHVSLVGPAPSFDRSVIVDPCNLYSEFLGNINSFTADNNPALIQTSAPSGLVHATFTLGPDRIEGLKTLVRSKAKSFFNCSTFVVCCAYLWTCIVKTRGYRTDIKANFGFPVDWRKRLQPPTPDTYFGNCLGPCFAEAKVGDLVREEDGVVAAAEAIGGAIEGLKGADSKGFAGSGSRNLALLVSECPLLAVAGSPKFKVYDVDFGWGRPLKVEVPSIKETGALSLAESRDFQGGLEIGLVLPKHEMEAIVTHFERSL